MDVDGIIFDLDGTLWDSCEMVAESWQATVRTHYDPAWSLSTQQIRSIMGMTVEPIAQLLFSDFGSKAMEVCLRCLSEECVYLSKHGGLIYPGARETLLKLSKRCKLFIVSNCGEGYVECFLEYAGFGGFFTDFLYPSLTGQEKSGNIRLMIDKYGLQHPVYVGDTAMDRDSAAQADCPFIHAAYGFGVIPDAPVAVGSFAELESAIELI